MEQMEKRRLVTLVDGALSALRTVVTSHRPNMLVLSKRTDKMLKWCKTGSIVSYIGCSVENFH
jgi:hypothetical protein